MNPLTNLARFRDPVRGGSTLQRPESGVQVFQEPDTYGNSPFGQHPIFVCSNPVLYWQNSRPLFCSVDCFEGKSTGKNQEFL